MKLISNLFRIDNLLNKLLNSFSYKYVKFLSKKETITRYCAYTTAT